MKKTITLNTMRDQVIETLQGWGDFDVDKIVESVHAVYGLCDIDDVPSYPYWAIVASHDTSE